MKEIHIKLGEVLKLERERRKITLEDASDQLKISQENLEFVENGQVEEAPSELYFGLFAKSFAEFLGIDYTGTLEAIKDEYGVLEPDVKGTPSAETSDETSDSKSDDSDEPAERSSGVSKKLLVWIGVIIAALTIVLLVWILVFDSGVDLSQVDRNLSSPENLTEGSGNVEVQVDEAASKLANYEYGTPPSAPPDPIRFQMIASQECWATVLADGDTAIFRNLIPDRQYDVQANYRFRISIAHPRVVRTFVNGTEVDLRNPETRRISRVRINQTNLAQIMSQVPAEPEPANSETTTVPAAPDPVISTKAEPKDSLEQDSAGGL